MVAGATIWVESPELFAEGCRSLTERLKLMKTRYLFNNFGLSDNPMNIDFFCYLAYAQFATESVVYIPEPAVGAANRANVQTFEKGRLRIDRGEAFSVASRATRLQRE